jgi:PemK-like, MazF-like toxin of type II toxin-antitoxin system
MVACVCGRRLAPEPMRRSPTGGHVRPTIEPGQVWFVDFDPVRGREQGKDRPAMVVVSSAFHLDLTARRLVTVLPLTSVERLEWVLSLPPSVFD